MYSTYNTDSTSTEHAHNAHPAYPAVQARLPRFLMTTRVTMNAWPRSMASTGVSSPGAKVCMKVVGSPSTAKEAGPRPGKAALNVELW